jgi:hypothetical protein
MVNVTPIVWYRDSMVFSWILDPNNDNDDDDELRGKKDIRTLHWCSWEKKIM